MTCSSTNVASIFEWHPSEATGLLCAAARGVRGAVRMRGSGLPARMSDQSPALWSVDSKAVYERNTVAQALRTATSLNAADEFIRSVVVRSELDIERAKARSGGDTTGRAGSVEELARRARHDHVDYLTMRYVMERTDLTRLDELDVRLANAGLERTTPPLIRHISK